MGASFSTALYAELVYHRNCFENLASGCQNLVSIVIDYLNGWFREGFVEQLIFLSPKTF